MFTRSRFARILKWAVFAAAAIIILGYASYRSLPYIQGPTIKILEPANGSVISTSTVRVIGKARRVNALSVNGMPISIDELGNFEKTLIVFRGMNEITIEAYDQFARKDSVKIRVLGSY